MVTSWIGWVFLNWLAADLIVGIFHWWEDQYAKSEWPFIGDWIASPNQLHHARPTAFLKGSYWQRNWTSIIPAFAAAGVAYYFYTPLVVPLLIASQGNEIHGWSHQKCNRFVRCLQEIEFLASVRHHARHHVDPFSTHYCVLSGWLNPVLDLLKFWFVIECLVFAFTGAKPRSWMEAK